MNVLIIEDDENKGTQLRQAVVDILNKPTITVARSLQSGLRQILEKEFDLILLDMTMPTYDIDLEEDGGRTQALAGRELLFQMDRRELEIPVIVITQFDRFGTGEDSMTLQELDLQLKKMHSGNYKGYVYYSTSLEGWKQALKKLIHRTIFGTERKTNV